MKFLLTDKQNVQGEQEGSHIQPGWAQSCLPQVNKNLQDMTC